ncbi:MAG: SRPBCC domain-containing protein [Sphingomonas sp.]|uniref:SRPBCC family protein n=1 Tax=Sphingomonas sp. TaxID=28214 RepID=UPI00120AE091|nr:SRPBCC domain-containing protein [Sphingomonas sp.]THD34482.1 MAG: SRPBCC domain-containing protein [Sphingomonas sp.]
MVPKAMLALMAVMGITSTAANGATVAKYPTVEDTSFASRDGTRVLQEEITIDAPASTLWRAYIDPVEFARWNAPVSSMDLRVGGIMEASYDPKAKLGDPGNIRNQIITFVPERMISFRNVAAPRNFSAAAVFQRTVTTVLFIPLDEGRTRVVVSTSGWQRGATSDQLIGFFRDANAQLLHQMKLTYGK